MSTPHERMGEILRRKAEQEEAERQRLAADRRARDEADRLARLPAQEAKERFEATCKAEILPLLETVNQSYLNGRGQLEAKFRENRYRTINPFCVALLWDWVNDGDGGGYYDKSIVIEVERTSGDTKYTPPIADGEYVLRFNDYLSKVKFVKRGRFGKRHEEPVWERYVSMSQPDWKEKVADAILAYLGAS